MSAPGKNSGSRQRQVFLLRLPRTMLHASATYRLNAMLAAVRNHSNAIE